MAFPTGWQRRVAVTIDNTLCGTADSADFTVLLTRDNLPDEICSPSDSNRAQSDGGDLRFSSDSSGLTPIALHVERWEYDSVDAAADADIALNIKVPTLNGIGTGSDSTVYLWYSTTGTDSQPASTDTYGAKNAYDSSHVLVYSLDESPSDTPPEYKESIAGFDLSEVNTLAQAAGKNGGNAIDTSGSAIARSDYPGFVAPDNASSSPFTNTGLCYMPDDDTLACSNYDDDKISIINKTTGAEISSFTVTQASTDLQGIAYDSVAEEFWAVLFGGASSTKYIYSKAGVYQRSLTIGSTGQAICYDFTDDAIWVNLGAGTLQQHNKSTGALIQTLTLTGGAAGITIEGVTHNSTSNTLYVTTDTGDMCYEVNKSTGATIQSFRGPFDIEHPAFDHTSEALWINGDAGFHSPSFSGENVTYKLDPDGAPFGQRKLTDQYTLEYWLYPDSLSGTRIQSAYWSTVRSGSMYHEIQSRGANIRAYSPDATYVESGTFTGSAWQHIWCEYDSTAGQMDVYKDNTSVISDSGAAGTLGPDARLGLGGRLAGTGSFFADSRFDSARLHNVVRSSSWRTARYNNTNSPSTFASAGTPEDAGLAVPVFAHHYNTLARAQ